MCTRTMLPVTTENTDNITKMRISEETPLRTVPQQLQPRTSIICTDLLSDRGTDKSTGSTGIATTCTTERGHYTESKISSQHISHKIIIKDKSSPHTDGMMEAAHSTKQTGGQHIPVIGTVPHIAQEGIMIIARPGTTTDKSTGK